MNIVTMNLVDLPFNQIKEGSKVIEVRLNDEKRQNIKVGDKIVFTNTKTNTFTNTFTNTLSLTVIFAILKMRLLF